MYLEDIIERIKLPFRKNKELYSSFHKILGFYPHNITFYEQALHHKSSSIKKEGGRINNERLEFLGDAVLSTVVGDIVFRRFAKKGEGFLTNTRSKIVKRESLNRLATETGLDKLIISSTHTNAHNSYMGGNAFEAMVGAIYLDRGYNYCIRFVQYLIKQNLIDIEQTAKQEVNFKSKLIEWGQKRHVEVTFNLIEEKKEGSATPVFTVQVSIEGVKCCKGTGYSKKESQQLAAKETLELLRKKHRITELIMAAKDQRDSQG